MNWLGKEREGGRGEEIMLILRKGRSAERPLIVGMTCMGGAFVIAVANVLSDGLVDQGICWNCPVTHLTSQKFGTLRRNVRKLAKRPQYNCCSFQPQNMP